MKRVYLLIIGLGFAFLAVAGLQGAAGTQGGAGVPPTLALRFRQLHRNRPLIEACVASGLSLAAEEDPLKRADCCNSLAQRLAKELQQAAQSREANRATELGEHLHSLVKRGVAANLLTVRRLTPTGSARESDIRRVGDRFTEFLRPLEDFLARTAKSDEQDLRDVHQTVRAARTAVELALKTKPLSKK
jgi:hypothetical protein